MFGEIKLYKKMTIFDQNTAMVSIKYLYEVVHGLFKEPIIGPLKSKMAEIRHLASFCHMQKRDFLKN